MTKAARMLPSSARMNGTDGATAAARASSLCLTEPAPRPLGVSVAGGLLAGVTLALWLPSLVPVWLLLVAALIGVPTWWRVWRGRGVGALLIGFALAGLHASHALSAQLPLDWEKRDVQVRGRIVELPLHQPRRTAFVLRVDRTADQPEALRGRLLRLSWYDTRNGSSTGREQLQAGQRWQMPVRLRAPRGLRNPGGFDSEKHAFANRVTASGHLRNAKAARLQKDGSGINAWRGAMSARIGNAFRSPRASLRLLHWEIPAAWMTRAGTYCVPMV